MDPLPPCRPEEVAPGVKKPSDPDLMVSMTFCCFRVMSCASGGNVVAACGPKVERCGAISPTDAISAALVVVIGVVRVEDVLTGAVIITS